MPSPQHLAARLGPLAATALLLAACSGSPEPTTESSAPASDGGGSSATAAPATDPATTEPSGTPDADEEALAPESSPATSGQVDLETFAVDGGYAFSALDQDIYCVLNPAGEAQGNVVGENLETSDDPGVACKMATYAPSDPDDAADEGVARCLAESAEDGIGEPAGGEPELTDDLVAYSGCRTDVSSFQSDPEGTRDRLGDVVPLEPGQSVTLDGFTCAAEADTLQCTRGDGRGWKVSATEYSMIS